MKNIATLFDPIRKKHVTATPEEHVRQGFVHFLLSEMNIPKSYISIETAITVNDLKKRCDIIIYNKNYKPLLIVECKAASVSLTQQVFDQIAAYNLTLLVPYLIITNGAQTYCCKVDLLKKEFQYLPQIPTFEEMQLNAESQC